MLQRAVVRRSRLISVGQSLHIFDLRVFVYLINSEVFRCIKYVICAGPSGRAV